MTIRHDDAPAAALVLPAPDLDATVAFFVGELGFRVELVFPADEPRVVVVAGHGLRLRLERDAAGDAGRLRIEHTGDARVLTAPNGTAIELVRRDDAVVVPPLSEALTLTRAADHDGWHVGRAGMLYRDLVPGRLGGAFVASHIRIPDGGPVPDYVHFHEVRFQAIWCVRGAVRVVYEGQGEPFWLREGDCVLQPPRIRHRVLECTPGLEVVEIASPAEHVTRAELSGALPHGDAPDRWDGQRFVRHVAEGAAWRPVSSGFERRDTGIGAATGDLLQVTVARVAAAGAATLALDERRPRFGFVLAGAAVLAAGERAALAAGDAFTLPARAAARIESPSRDFALLEVRWTPDG